MDLRRLEVFAKVAELGSFSRAADALSLTQPTHAGRLLLGYARRMLALQREARQALDQFQGRMSGELVVGGSTIPGEYVLPALIGRFKGKYPDISICLLIGSSRQVTEWVEAGRAEVGVVGAPPGPKTLLARELMADELVLVVPAGHAWTNRKTVALADGRRGPVSVLEQGSGSREALERALDQADTDLSAFRVVGEMGSTQAIKQGVRAGVGIALVSKRAVEDECRAGLLFCLRVHDLRVGRAFYLVTHSDRSRSPLATAFVLFVVSECTAEASVDCD